MKKLNPQIQRLINSHPELGMRIWEDDVSCVIRNQFLAEIQDVLKVYATNRMYPDINARLLQVNIMVRE